MKRGEIAIQKHSFGNKGGSVVTPGLTHYPESKLVFHEWCLRSLSVSFSLVFQNKFLYGYYPQHWLFLTMQNIFMVKKKTTKNLTLKWFQLVSYNYLVGKLEPWSNESHSNLLSRKSLQHNVHWFFFCVLFFGKISFHPELIWINFPYVSFYKRIYLNGLDFFFSNVKYSFSHV